MAQLNSKQLSFSLPLTVYDQDRMADDIMKKMTIHNKAKDKTTW